LVTRLGYKAPKANANASAGRRDDEDAEQVAPNVPSKRATQGHDYGGVDDV